MVDKISKVVTAVLTISEIRAEISEIQTLMLLEKDERETAGADKYNASSAIASLKSGRQAVDLSSHDQRELKNITDRLDDASCRFERADKAYDEHANELDSLSEQLQCINDGAIVVTINDITKAQGRIKKAQASVDAIQSCIDSQMMTIQAATDALQPIELLHQSRNDLLADSALGADNKAELEDVDGKIATMNEKVTETEKSSKDAEHTSQGLRCKLMAAKETVNGLNDDLSVLVRQFIKGEAEGLISQYTEQAKPLLKSFKELHALNQLMVDRFRFEPMISSAHQRACIPSFTLKEGAVVAGVSSELFSFYKAMDSGGFVGTKVTAVENLRKVGLLG